MEIKEGFRVKSGKGINEEEKESHLKDLYGKQIYPMLYY